MDQDEFNDFQQATYAQQGADPILQPNQLNLPQVSLQNSLSMQPNIQSQDLQPSDIEEDMGPVPHLAKMGSDCLVMNDHLDAKFTKRKSQRQLIIKDHDQRRNKEGEYDEYQSKLSNVATLHSQQQQDFDLTFPNENDKIGEQQPHSEIANQFQTFQREEASPEVLTFSKPVLFEKKMEKEQIFTEEREQKYIANGTQLNQTNAKEENQRLSDRIENLERQEDGQSIAVDQKYQKFPEEIALSNQRVEESVEDYPIENKKEEEREVQQQNEIHVELAEDEQDQFGDFEQETTQQNQKQQSASSQINQGNSKQEDSPQIKQTKLEPQLPPSRQQQLRRFTEALPDYTFLLKQSFNSL